MGNSSSLYLDGFHVVSTKEGWEPEAMTLFTEADKIVLPYKEAVEIDEGEDEDYLPEYYFAYSTSVSFVKDRLEFMGFSLNKACGIFREGLLEEVEEYKKIIETTQYEMLKDRYTFHISVMQDLTLDTWLEGLVFIIKNELSGKYDWVIPEHVEELNKFPDHIRYMLNSHNFGFPDNSVRAYIRALIEVLGIDGDLVYDFSDLTIEESLSVDEELCENALSFFADKYVRDYKIVVLTEGSSDRWAIQSALQLFYPHLASYYSFMDFDTAKVQGGAGHLASTVKSFIGAGIVNRVVAFFDNDTAAKAAMKPLSQIRIPINTRIYRYPDIDIARNYPTLGPQGTVSMDVNGLACGLELYFGSDVLQEEDGSLCPIQWKGYDDATKQYQGEVMKKDMLKARYAEKLKKCQTHPDLIDKYDWSGMRVIIDRLLTAFHDD